VSEAVVLVVGTTPDYVDYIHGRYPDRVLFLTDTAHRGQPSGRGDDTGLEILTELKDTDRCRRRLREYLGRRRLRLSGVTCYDCEWLGLTAALAQSLGLPYVSPEAVRLSRDKGLSKAAWQAAGVRCPQYRRVNHCSDAVGFARGLSRPVVVKPLTGSGSELTFRAETDHEVAHGFGLVRLGLEKRQDSPMYRTASPADRDAVLVEEFIAGREYSADFVVDGTCAEIVRVARKIRSGEQPFGTTRAYVVPGRLPGRLSREVLGASLLAAARALGLDRGPVMADFMITGSEVVFLEMTPRIGGDCLPPLIRRSCGLDTIGLALDLAEGRPAPIPAPAEWHRLIGLRLFAAHSGRLTAMDMSAVESDPRVLEISLKRSAGHDIALPPEDYDSWQLGHVIFRPDPQREIEWQCREIEDLAVVSIEPLHGERSSYGLHAETSRAASA
jgi:biotin carboxylase